MSNNPYQSPLDSSEAIPTSEFSRLRLTLFGVNFVASACLTAFLAYIALGMPSGMLLPGILFQDFLFVFYALCELYAVFRKDFSLERKLGWANLVFAFLLLKFFGDEIYETFLLHRPVDTAFAVKVMAIIYVAFSALVRLRWANSTASEAGRLKDR